jgi:tetratricopeptide (TPR) repeat protein
MERALILAVVCVTVGFAGGWFVRGGQTPEPSGASKAASASPMVGHGRPTASQPPSPAQLKAMADAQAAPLLERLKSDSNNPDLLAAIGNIYYDAKQYPAAVDYYGRALKAKPADASVRTDMATAYWYMGNADTAIAEFNKALTYAPNNPNTLFNLGLVKWQGKKDIDGAEADWKKLLAANPNYAGKDKVQQMMAEAKHQAAVKPEMNAK